MSYIIDDCIVSLRSNHKEVSGRVKSHVSSEYRFMKARKVVDLHGCSWIVHVPKFDLLQTVNKIEYLNRTWES